MSKKEFALIGFPLGHSKSPYIHKRLMERADIPGTYTCREIPPQELSGSQWLFELDGFNVTIPHKTNIIPLLSELSEKATLFGAVNTVKVKDGRGVGYNTDCIGFLRALESAGITLGGKVLVLGSGGVSRMFAYEAVLAGANLTIASRNTDTANKIKDEIEEKLGKGCKVISLDGVRGGYDLIINGTPVGMTPRVDDCPISRDAVASSKAVFDAIYNPAETLLLRYARENGLKYSNGLPMLVWQAAAAEEIWNEISFEKSDVEAIISELEKAE